MPLQRHGASKRKRDYPICLQKYPLLLSASECTLVVQGATEDNTELHLKAEQE